MSDRGRDLLRRGGACSGQSLSQGGSDDDQRRFETLGNPASIAIDY